VAIVGAGPIGLLLLQVIQQQGAGSITVAERQPARLELAKSFGADRVVSSADSLGKGVYDVVVDATGAVGVMSRTLEWVRRGGTILLFGVPPRDTELTMDAFAFFEKGVTVRSSFTSVRNSYQALGMLKSGQIDVEPLISHRLPLEAFERGVHLIEEGLESVKKVLLMPNE
jgi:threonine dehydrogenase-like Zn-dependent dehydrogenase